MKTLTFFWLGVILLFASGCRKKSETVEKEIREAGYEVTTEGWFEAVQANDVAVMRKMVEGGFDEKTKDAEGNSALHVAASTGGKDAGNFLLNRGFSVDETGAGGRTPLMAAVVAGQSEMVKWLLQQGADPMLKDNEGFMALMLAVTEGNANAVEELAQYHREELDSALLLAAIAGKAEVIDSLTNYGASVYAQMEDGRTALMLAAQNGHREAAALLIDIGASRFATTDTGETAQSFAVAAGHDEIAKMIETGFSGGSLALETDEEIAEAMVIEPDEQEVESGAVAVVEQPGEEAASAPEDSSGDGLVGLFPEEERATAVVGGTDPAVRGSRGDSAAPKKAGPVPGLLEGANVSAGTRRDGDLAAAEPGDANAVASKTGAPPLVMRQYRQRELPVVVRQVSGGVAALHFPGPEPKDLEVAAGETIPGSTLTVVKVFSRMETGKLNEGAPVEVGVIEVEDSRSGQRAEWVAGRPAAGHEPVALVEDAISGRRYVAKPGQKFTAEDGREFMVSDVRPTQLVIEEVATGEVSTLRLRGPKG